jgi:type I restriction enzyme R subunit
MGFPDKGSFEIFTLIRNESPELFDEGLVKDFSMEAVEKIKSRIYIGWQDVPREYERIQTDIELLSVHPKFEDLNIDTYPDLIERIMKSVEKFYSLL